MRRPGSSSVVIIFALLMTVMTWLGHWWSLALLPFAATIGDRGRAAPVWPFALAAALSWSALLAFDAMGARIGALARTLAGVMQLPSPLLVLVTVAFAALLAWSAAVVGQELARLMARWRARRA